MNTLTLLGDVHVRHRALQAFHGGRLQVPDLFLAEGRHRHRHVLDGLGAAARGHGDFVQLGGLRLAGRLRLLLGLHERGRCQQRTAHGHAQILALHWSPSSRV
jgi:hypothetical protein